MQWFDPAEGPAAHRRLRPRRPGALRSGAVALAGAILAVGGALLIAQPSGASAGGPDPSAATAARQQAAARWHTVPADQLLPPVLAREGTETYARVGVDPDESCAALPAALATALAQASSGGRATGAPTQGSAGPAGSGLSCLRLVQATYVDATQTVTATVGIVVFDGPSAAATTLLQAWNPAKQSPVYAEMPGTFAVPGTAAAGFGPAQRVAWGSAVAVGGACLVYTVAGFTDGRTGPAAAAFAARAASDQQASSPPVQVAADLPGAVAALLSGGSATAGATGKVTG